MPLLYELYQLSTDVAKKQQRGYLSFDEFTRIVNHVQELYFVELYSNPKTYQAGRPIAPMTAGQSQMVLDALNPFNKSVIATVDSLGVMALPNDYRHHIATYGITPELIDTCEELDRGIIRMSEIPIRRKNEVAGRLQSKKFAPTIQRPIMVQYESHYQFYPHNIQKVEFNYYRNPTPCKLAYTKVNNMQVYNPALTVELEWQEEQQRLLVGKVLSFVAMLTDEDKLLQFGEMKDNKL